MTNEREPITKELRELMSYQALVGTDTFKSRVAADPDAFDATCDNIDAIHRSLEEENESLREREQTLITLLHNDCDIDVSWDGLRKFWNIGLTEHGCLMRDRACKAEVENERLRNESERCDDWIKLPADADGVPIHVGDELWSDNGIWVKVERLKFENGKWAVFVEDKTGIGFYAAFEIIHHHRPDTWESIIEDAFYAGESGELDNGSYEQTLAALVARCKALCESTREGE